MITPVTKYYSNLGIPVPKRWRLRLGDIVLIKEKSFKSGYVQDRNGVPKRFVAVHFGKIRTLLRSEDMWKKDLTYQDVRFPTTDLELIERGKIIVPAHFQEIQQSKTWLKKGIGVNGGGDYIGTLRNNPEIKVLMSWRGINGRGSAPAFFFWHNRVFKISSEEVDEMVLHPLV